MTHKCPLRNLHQILQNGQLALNVRIPPAEYRYEAWKSTSCLRGAYVLCILVIWKTGFSSKAISSLNKENFKPWKVFKFSGCIGQKYVCSSKKVQFDLCNADHFMRYFKWIHFIHYIRGQCIPLRNTIPWKTCLWKDKYFFYSKLLEVYLFWWEGKQHNNTHCHVHQTNRQRRKTGNRNDWRLMLVFIPGAKKVWDLPRSPGLCKSQGRNSSLASWALGCQWPFLNPVLVLDSL